MAMVTLPNGTMVRAPAVVRMRIRTLEKTYLYVTLDNDVGGYITYDSRDDAERMATEIAAAEDLGNVHPYIIALLQEAEDNPVPHGKSAMFVLLAICVVFAIVGVF